MEETRTITLLIPARDFSIYRPILFVWNPFGMYRRIICSGFHCCLHKRGLQCRGSRGLAYQTCSDVVYKACKR
jgi:hypothetical protein